MGHLNVALVLDFMGYILLMTISKPIFKDTWLKA
jgi:hypothetical protein